MAGTLLIWTAGTSPKKTILSKAMYQLAQLDSQLAPALAAYEYDRSLAGDELRHPTLASLPKCTHTQKVQVILQSKIEKQYCLGVANLEKETNKSSSKCSNDSRQAPHGSSKPLL